MVHLSIRWTAAVSVTLLAVLLGAGYAISRPMGHVLTSAGIGAASISPNADGLNDAATLSYRLERQAVLSIYFEGDTGERHYFRRDENRSRGDYAVLFSGVVEGFALPGEQTKGEIINRLLPPGDYLWVVEATDVLTGQTDRITGKLSITDPDTLLPDLYDFTISPEVFTPNQDGFDDRVYINVYVPKPAQLLVYLIDADGKRYFIPEAEEARAPGEAGRHSFQYDGGVDNGIDPPPDGTYQVLVEARDDEGQTVRQQGEVTIQNGGLPLAEIVGQPVGHTVEFNAETIVVGDLLTFTLTVENYGDSPIRTTGPMPGYVYEQGEVYSSTGFYEESGAWRVGIHCDTCLTDYPWRWALGTPETLTVIRGQDGRPHYYLMPGQREVVTGSIRLTNIVPSRNPQQFWAGLIHEDVEISPINNRVDPRWIEIVPAANATPTLAP